MRKTLGDVRDAGADILAECRACRRSAIVPVGPLVDRYGEHTTLLSIGRRMRCTKCGARFAWARSDEISRPPDDIVRPGYYRKN